MEDAIRVWCAFCGMAGGAVLFVGVVLLVAWAAVQWLGFFAAWADGHRMEGKVVEVEARETCSGCEDLKLNRIGFVSNDARCGHPEADAGPNSTRIAIIQDDAPTRPKWCPRRHGKDS